MGLFRWLVETVSGKKLTVCDHPNGCTCGDCGACGYEPTTEAETDG